ncbi:heterokaryon incompatibility protein-domain-containing protein [Xylariaceae sp. FL0255]|nr:heterokaryon incompatibility protein-domain-containing protein [Xylariaceae sp. FL0255]
MRLLNTQSLRLETFLGSEKPAYAILSHTWGHDEVLFTDIQAPYPQPWRERGGASFKILNSARIAAERGLDYIWIDTCCIDKDSSAELSEAINSMYNWYSDSAVCIAYLSDVSIHPSQGTDFSGSRWFTRGWTLQELIAPSQVEFFDVAWNPFGSRASRAEDILRITGIDSEFLDPPLVPRLVVDSHSMGFSKKKNPRKLLTTTSIHSRMTWASCRQTSREEDLAYCLLGLFDVNMPLLYGEGLAKAFRRLQEEIIKGSNDQSILLNGAFGLARSPSDFSSAYKFQRNIFWKGPNIRIVQERKDALQVSLQIAPVRVENFSEDGMAYLGILECLFDTDPSRLHRPAFYLDKIHPEKNEYRQMAGGVIASVKKKKDKQGGIEVVHSPDLDYGGRLRYVGLDQGGLNQTLDPRKIKRMDILLLGYHSTFPANIFQPLLPIFVQNITNQTRDLVCLYEICPERGSQTHEDSPAGESLIMSSSRFIMGYDFRLCALIVLGPTTSDYQHFPTLALLVLQHFNDIRFKPSVIAHLVDLATWLSKEDCKNLNFSDLEQMRTYVKKLPILQVASDAGSGDVMEKLVESYDPKNGAVFVVNDAVVVSAKVSLKDFLEEKFAELYIEVQEKGWHMRSGLVQNLVSRKK